MAAFILNALLFLLVGLQLRSVLDGIGGRDAGTLAWQATAVVLVLIALRLAWMFAVPSALRLSARLLRGTCPEVRLAGAGRPALELNARRPVDRGRALGALRRVR